MAKVAEMEYSIKNGKVAERWRKGGGKVAKVAEMEYSIKNGKVAERLRECNILFEPECQMLKVDYILHINSNNI